MTLKQRIVKYLNNNPRWFRKAEIIEIAVNKGCNGDSVGRALRELYEEGLIQREDYIQQNKVKGAKYASLYVQKEKKPEVKIIIKDGIRVAVYD